MNIEISTKEYFAVVEALVIYANERAKLLRRIVGSADSAQIKLAEIWLPDYIGARSALKKLGCPRIHDPVFRFKKGLLVEERSEDEQGTG